MTAFNDVQWVKKKERNIDIAIESLYCKGRERKYFLHMGVDFALLNHAGYKDGRLYYDQEELERGKALFVSDPVSLGKKVTKNFLAAAKRMERFAKELRDCSEMPDEELLAVLTEHIELNCDLIPYASLFSMFLEDLARELITKHIKGKDPLTIYAKIVVPKKANVTNGEYLSRLKIAVIGKGIDQHLENYQWITCYTPARAPLTKEALQEEIDAIEHPNERNTERQSSDAREEADALLATLNLPRDTLQLVDLMRENAWVRTYRREVMSKGFFAMRPVYEEIMKRMELPYDDIAELACWELQKFLKTGKRPSDEELQRRKEDFVIFSLGQDSFIKTGADIANYQIQEKTPENVRELNGVAVSKGTAKGSAQIVKKHEHMKDFNRGDILVVHSVCNWMTPILGKCSGIVAEAGGVLSHTAVVAREMQKPCVIGTNVATRTFANGDTIEVDTEKGVVRRVD